jgi:hypothetical protein
MIKRVRKIQALIHEELRLFVLGRHRKYISAEFLQPRRDGAGWRRRLLGRFNIVNVVGRWLLGLSQSSLLKSK